MCEDYLHYSLTRREIILKFPTIHRLKLNQNHSDSQNFLFMIIPVTFVLVSTMTGDTLGPRVHKFVFASIDV